MAPKQEKLLINAYPLALSNMFIFGIAYHHTGDSSPDPQFIKVDNYHMAKKFPKSKLGYYVGYHYFIGKDGTIKQARSEDERGAHVVNCGCGKDKSGLPADTANFHYIGICLAGDLRKEQPSSRQLSALVALTKDVMRRHSLNEANLLNHSDFKATSCPGIDLSGEVKKILDLERRISMAESALDRVIPERRNKLLRFIERARRILFPT